VAPTPTPQQTFAAALAVGLTVTWTTSTTLNGIYALDPATQFNITTEIVSILKNGTFTNGQATRGWPTTDSTYPVFTVAQFGALATIVALYVDALNAAQATALAGGSPTWPNASVTIDL